MTPAYRRLVLCACALALQIACGSDSNGPTDAPVDGTWSGHGSKNGAAVNVFVVLEEDASVITGTGSIAGSGPHCGLAVSGTRSGSHVSLSLTCAGFTPFTFTGTQRASALDGHFSGSGLPQIDLVLNRQ